MTTQALHLELVTDLTAARFLLALRRFMSLYGTPKYIRSDNGSNFVGAATEIRKMIKTWRGSQHNGSVIMKFCEEKLINWTFSKSLITELWRVW